MNAVERARAQYADGEDIVIHDHARTDDTEDGTWVEAWVWVEKEDRP